MSKPSRITTDVDFSKPGKQRSWLRLPYSADRSAYGWIPIPVVCISNGEGPTVMLTAANHGDEFEGPIVLSHLLNDVEPGDVTGRLIILPALNVPAFEASLRVSPIDDLNLNRTFPGKRDGSPTEIIAHYVESELMPMVDYAVDLHSGGKSLMYVPSVLTRFTEDTARNEACLKLLESFGAPISYVMSKAPEDRSLAAAAERSGAIFIGTELAGGGSVDPSAVRLGREGVRNVLIGIGALKGEPTPPRHTPRIVHVASPEHYLYATDEGVFEPLFEPGDDVEAGQLAGLIHRLNATDPVPVPMHFPVSGLALCKRAMGRCVRGDALAQIGSDFDRGAVRQDQP